jgi:hypothetical protein
MSNLLIATSAQSVIESYLRNRHLATDLGADELAIHLDGGSLLAQTNDC